jgi:periplasmic divalent cation tolerance protein
MPSDVWVGLCTAPDAETAARLGRLAVEGGHAACANLLPGVRSIYRWRGRVEDEAEVLVVFKTTAAAWPGLARMVAGAHPYDVPELIALPLTAGLEPYLRWVRESTAAGATRGEDAAAAGSAAVDQPAPAGGGGPGGQPRAMRVE